MILPRDPGGNISDGARPAVPAEQTWQLRLYVAGRAPHSLLIRTAWYGPTRTA